jgi:hypothetical protein
MHYLENSLNTALHPSHVFTSTISRFVVALRIFLDAKQTCAVIVFRCDAAFGVSLDSYVKAMTFDHVWVWY